MRKHTSSSEQRTIRQISTLLMILALLVAALPATRSSAAPQDKPPYAPKQLFFASDGMRPDLVEKWAQSGDLPNYAKIFNEGVVGENGMVPQFPPNTGAGWSSMTTGAWGGTHGTVNNTFHMVTNGVLTSTSAYNATLLQAETYGEVAEKAGKKVAILDWPGTLPGTRVKGPVVDFRNFYSGRGVVGSYEAPGVLMNFVRDFGLVYTTGLQVADASGWTGAPQSFSPAKESLFSFNTNVISNTAAPLNWPLYIYDSTDDGQVNYDRVLLGKDSKDAAAKAGDLKAGDWQGIKLNLPQNGLLVGFYVKLLDLSADGTQFRLYFSSLARVRSNMPDLEQYITENFPPTTAADFAPIEAGLVGADTYTEQGLKWYDTFGMIHEYVIRTYNPDVVMAGIPTTDEFSHQFMALATPGYTGPRPPYGQDPAQAENYIKSGYKEADEALGRLWELLGPDTSVVIGADHGFAPAWRSVNVNLVLQNAGLYDPANRGASKAVGYIAGGTANIYVNLAGREIGGVVSTTDYSLVRTQIMDAFNNLTDNGAKVAAAVWTKEQTRAIKADGYTINGWNPTRTGDVVVVLQSPYMFDAPTAGQVVADAAFFGQHGYLPDAVDLSKNINMHAMFGLAGPGVARAKRIPSPRTIDLAPTAAYALGILAPRNAEGRVLTEAFSDESPTLVPIQVLSWSDYHGQLDPLTVTLDRLTVPTGGVANLMAYWNDRKAENPNGTILLSAGDNIGATPPNSAFLGDVPIIQAMNLMGFTASAAGNHEFDKGVAGLQPLVNLAQFPYLADNIVDAAGQIPSFLKPYIVVKVNGIDVGIIGVGNPDTPNVTNPLGVQGLRFLDPVEPTNRYVRELVGRGVRTIIVVAHLGATSGDFDNQTGALADLAKGADPEVDLIIGGHNRINTLTRINNILVHEGNNAQTTGRFTLLVDPATKNVTASWGAFDRPLGGALTPDPALATLVRNANDQIRPILGEQVGTSATLVDRSRGAESKMGNLVSDAIRATYQVDVALQNSGGLRADLQPAPITRGDVFAVLPFGNLVVTGKLKGSDLLAALENGVSDVSGSAGRFIQLSGLRFAYDASKPVGQRVLWAVLSNGQALDPNATYSVAANDFMWVGGDGYTSLTRITDGATREQLYEVAVNYVKSLGTVNPQTEGRIVAAQAGQPAPTPPTAATPALPTPISALPTAAPATAVPVPTPAPVPTGVVPGMPTTGAGDGATGWLSLLLAAALLLSLGLLLARRPATR